MPLLLRPDLMQQIFICYFSSSSYINWLPPTEAVDLSKVINIRHIFSCANLFILLDPLLIDPFAVWASAFSLHCKPFVLGSFIVVTSSITAPLFIFIEFCFPSTQNLMPINLSLGKISHLIPHSIVESISCKYGCPPCASWPSTFFDLQDPLGIISHYFCFVKAIYPQCTIF